MQGETSARIEQEGTVKKAKTPKTTTTDRRLVAAFKTMKAEPAAGSHDCTALSEREARYARWRAEDMLNAKPDLNGHVWLYTDDIDFEVPANVRGDPAWGHAMKCDRAATITRLRQLLAERGELRTKGAGDDDGFDR
jgi:hypothetical protein